MKICIQKISNKNKKIAENFRKREWKKFNKEKGYKWDEKKYSFIATDNKKIIGFVDFKTVGGAAYLKQLIVSKESRRAGMGDLLIKKFEDIAKKNKCHLAYLETSEKHKEALRFYKKHGYKNIAKLKNNKFHFVWYFLAKNLK